MSAASNCSASESIRSIADLKGKSVGVKLESAQATICSRRHGGACRARPRQGHHWVTEPISVKPVELFADGKIDAFLGFPPEPQDLRARHIGHVIVNTTRRPPLVAVFLLHAGGQPGIRAQVSGRDQARAARHPQGDRSLRHRAGARRATARRWRFHPPLRLCPADAERGPYDKWREYDAEDTIRFYALRLHEAGFIKSSPQKIIADGTDWRFLNELKRELKA